MKIRNLLLPSLATDLARGLNAAMQHKQDRTVFLFGTHWKSKWVAFLNTLAYGRVACPNGLHRWQVVLNFGPLSIIVNWRMVARKKRALWSIPTSSLSENSLFEFFCHAVQMAKKKTPTCDRLGILVYILTPSREQICRFPCEMMRRYTGWFWGREQVYLKPVTLCLLWAFDI